MDIKILKYKESDRANPVGYALVEMGAKLRVWMTVLKNSSGHKFVVMPSIRIDEEFIPCIEVGAMGDEKIIISKINDALKNELN